MDICSEGHEEIVHNEGWKSCPLCAALRTIEDKDEEIKTLNDQIDELTSELEEIEKSCTQPAVGG